MVPHLMSENIDWLHSHTDVCKVDLYSPKVEKEQDPKVDAGGSGSGGKDNLEKLKEKEIIVIKDTEKQDSSKVFSEKTGDEAMERVKRAMVLSTE
ncbi:A-kinase anchoring protein 4 [Rhinolophus ferrumequinum]|uniref:A-kinase anchoring protein 4 n=1 Tax=Rhinolophus ferrumequinum TaxID=59479 RepID=A0A7J8ATR0_RHIFE|nr:A-kinase anchoring protein 4 [Rhinolophus ferrumequinum]